MFPSINPERKHKEVPMIQQDASLKDYDDLAQALADYESAELGRLNVTADALREAAARCGYDREAHGVLRAWAEHRVELYKSKIGE